MRNFHLIGNTSKNSFVRFPIKRSCFPEPSLALRGASPGSDGLSQCRVILFLFFENPLADQGPSDPLR